MPFIYELFITFAPKLHRSCVDVQSDEVEFIAF